MATPEPTVTSVMTKVCHMLGREHDANPRSHRSRALWKLHRLLYPAFVREYEAEQRAKLSPPRPTKPEEGKSSNSTPSPEPEPKKRQPISGSGSGASLLVKPG